MLPNSHIIALFIIMVVVEQPADASSSQGNDAGLAPVAQAETQEDMPSGLSHPNTIPLPLSAHEAITSPLSNSDPIRSFHHIPPSQQQGEDAGPAPAAQAETEKDMPSASSDCNTIPLPPSSNAIRGLDQIPPLQPRVLRIRRVRFHMKQPPETLLDHHIVDVELIQAADDDEAARRRLPPVNLGKVFLGLTYQAMVAFMVFHFSSTIDMDKLRHSNLLSVLLNFSEVTVVIGFAASLVGVLMRELVSTEMAMVAEKAGSASAALGFFLMMSMFLSKLSIGIGWVCAVVSFLAFVFVFVKMRKAG